MKTAPKKWRDELASNAEFGKHVLKTDGRLPSLFVIHHPTGQVTPFSACFRSGEQKRAIIGLMTMIAIASEAVAVSLTVEAWLKIGHMERGETTEDSRKRILGDKSVMDYEDRKEVLMCSIVYRDDADERHTIADLWEIERDAEGKIASFLSIERAQMQHEGVMIDILPEERPSAEMVKAANLFCVEHAVEMMRDLDVSTPTEDMQA